MLECWYWLMIILWEQHLKRRRRKKLLVDLCASAVKIWQDMFNGIWQGRDITWIISPWLPFYVNLPHTVANWYLLRLMGGIWNFNTKYFLDFPLKMNYRNLRDMVWNIRRYSYFLIKKQTDINIASSKCWSFSKHL